MTVTLTAAEKAMLADLAQENEQLENVLHRILAPMLAKHGEARLQRLADEYRLLTPDLQIEAIAVLKEWQASKV